jgi:tetratricopeptide (TPR) repeat protein
VKPKLAKRRTSPQAGTRVLQQAPRARSIVLALAALTAITFGAYSGAFDNAFVEWDDPSYVTENPFVLQKNYDVLSRGVFLSNYHPLTMCSYALNVSAPPSPTPFIVTNVILHTLNTGLVFWLSYMLSRRRLAVAFLSALLFGIHPMHVESVAWISERKDVLYVFFFLAGAIAYWRYLDKHTMAGLGLTFALFLLSCLSKGMAVVFPVIMLLLDYWKRRPILERRAILEKIPFFATALFFGLIAMDVQSGGNFHGLLIPEGLRAIPETVPFSIFHRVMFSTYGHLMYVWKLFLPIHLSALYPYPETLAQANDPKFALAFPFFLGTLALVVWSVRKARVIAFGVGWYLACIIPVLQWVPVGSAIMADRYTYLSYFGLVFAIAMGIGSLVDRYRARRAILSAGLALVLGLLFIQTTRQVETWKDSETLWGNVIQYFPQSDLPYVLRGNARGKNGQIQGAMADLQTALRLGSRRAEMYSGLGIAYANIGKPDSAVLMLDSGLRVRPDDGQMYYNRAIADLVATHPRQALADLEKAHKLMLYQPPSMHLLRGNAYMQLAIYPEAIAEYDSAIAARISVAGALYYRGICKLGLRDTLGAMVDFREDLHVDPSNALATKQMESITRRH